jgi:hypothetical protein
LSVTLDATHSAPDSTPTWQMCRAGNTLRVLAKVTKHAEPDLRQPVLDLEFRTFDLSVHPAFHFALTCAITWRTAAKTDSSTLSANGPGWP